MTWRVLPWAMLVAALAGAAYLYQRSAVAEQSAEARDLVALGQIVVAGRTAAALATEAKRMTDDNVDLRAALAAARRAAPGAQVVAVVSASTGPIEAAPAHPPGAEGVPELSTAAAPACLLSSGDRAEIRVDEIVLEAMAGTRVLVGAASAWRLDPPARLFGGGFSTALTEAAAVEPERSWLSSWGAGPLVVASGAGLAYGAVVASPHITVGPLSLEGVVGAAVGGGGIVGSVAVVGRLSQ